jgi:two-component system, NtrC family, response regulator AtoC
MLSSYFIRLVKRNGVAPWHASCSLPFAQDDNTSKPELYWMKPDNVLTSNPDQAPPVVSSGPSERYSFDRLTGASPSMRQLFLLLQRLAQGVVPVLILGEAGTEKESAARALHNRGPRRQRVFASVACGQLSQQQLEARLFGPTPDSIATGDPPGGLLLQVSGGTLFLDEIDALAPALQQRLLRRLREPLPARGAGDLRLILGASRELPSAASGLRGELLQRLSPVQITLPPLRERGNDVLLLAQEILESLAAGGQRPPTIAPGAATCLLAYSWPGNRRQLEDCLRRAAASASGGRIEAKDLDEAVRSAHSSVAASPDARSLISLEEIERRYIQLVMTTVKGNKTRAARVLGLDRTTLYRKLDRYRQESQDSASQNHHSAGIAGLPLPDRLL